MGWVAAMDDLPHHTSAAQTSKPTQACLIISSPLPQLSLGVSVNMHDCDYILRVCGEEERVQGVRVEEAEEIIEVRCGRVSEGVPD